MNGRTLARHRAMVGASFFTIMLRQMVLPFGVMARRWRRERGSRYSDGERTGHVAHGTDRIDDVVRGGGRIHLTSTNPEIRHDRKRNVARLQQQRRGIVG